MSDLYRVIPMAIPVVVIWSSPGGVAIRYVFPVLLMTSYLYCRYTIWGHVDAVSASDVIAASYWLHRIVDDDGRRDQTSPYKVCRAESAM